MLSFSLIFSSVTIPIQSVLLLLQILKLSLPCQYHSLPFLLPPVLTFLPSCSWHHPWATLTLRWLLPSSSCWPRHLFHTNSLFSTPHLLLTSLHPSQLQFSGFLDNNWTTTENTDENLPLETKSPLQVSHWKSCSPSYTWILLFRDGSCAVRSHQWFLRAKAISIQAQIIDFSCQMQKLLLSQGKLRYFKMRMSGLNTGGFPKEKGKDTFLQIPGSFFLQSSEGLYFL